MTQFIIFDLSQWSRLGLCGVLITFALLSLEAQAADKLDAIKLPAGFSIQVFADSTSTQGQLLAGARFMAFDAEGNLYVTSAKHDKLVMLPDNNHDGVADKVMLITDKLNAPQGLAFVNDDLLIANQDGVVKLKKVDLNAAKNGVVAKLTPFISNLPEGGHTLKSLKLSPDGYLFINVGSSCNVCIENDAMRASILRYTVDGKPAGVLQTSGRHAQSAIWARGLRNSQGFAWHPVTKQMYATNNGADMRASSKNGAVNDDLPPEHINIIEAGKHYGWPYCWGGLYGQQPQTEDPNFSGEVGFCNRSQAPVLNLISHSTPIGITFLNQTNWPSDYQQDAIVALHGSWNRKIPSGYQLVRLKFSKNQPIAVQDFATGWLQANGEWGRPVDVVVGTDHALYVSDDEAGAIYRITYRTK